MVGRRKPVTMEAPHAAGGQDAGLRAHDSQPAGVQVLQDRAGTATLRVAHQLDRRLELENRNLATPYLVGKHAHDLEAGALLRGVAALPRMPSTCLSALGEAPV